MSSIKWTKIPTTQISKLRWKKQLYSTKIQGDTIGTKFHSKEDINKFFEANKWDGRKLLLDNESNLTESQVSKAIKPSDEMIFKLLKLSGLSQKDVDLEGIRHTLRKQIQFINILQNVKLTEKETQYDTNNARILPHESKPLKYDDLLDLIEKQKYNRQPNEISGSWKPTPLASKTRNGFYILKLGLIKNGE